MTEEHEWIVETRGLTRVYGEVEPIYALNQVDICIAKGELVAVMGPSGSGKSTLLNMIGALDLPTEGTVKVAGQDMTKVRNKDRFRGKTVGFIFQLHNLIPTLTARENVEVPMMGYSGLGGRRKRAEDLLAKVGLADRLNHLPGQLSGGQRQRVAVARALANNPAIVLADEPTGSLDSAAGGELMALIRELNQNEGTTFIIVTHDPNVARQTNRVLVMSDGKIVREDIIGSALEEDLKMWRHSELGKRILTGETNGVEDMFPTPNAVDVLRQIFEETNHDSH